MADFQSLPTEFWAIFFLVFGMLWGSFANVVIYRLPAGKSVVKPRSACPKCQKPISWYENIPVFSWLFLRGKCGGCKTNISIRYPLVELITGLLFMALYLRLGLSWTLLEYIIFAFGLVVCSFIDFDHMILPDSFTLSGIVIGLVGAVLSPEREFLPSLLGVLVGGGFLWAVAVIYYVVRKQEGMGGGDIKLLGWIGAVLGWTSVPFVIMASSVIGSVVGVSLALSKGKNMKIVIPFGPYLALAALIYIFAGQEITSWYFSMLIPGTDLH